MRDFLKWLTIAIVIATALKAALDQVVAAEPEFTIPTRRNPNA